MAEGMAGHLHEIYPNVGETNAWRGGNGDVWERGPYWLDGAVPLAYVLDDDRLKEVVRPYLEWTLESQRPDGYFGPPPDKSYANRDGFQTDRPSDWWPRMVMLKVLQVHHSATGDGRPDGSDPYMRYDVASEIPRAGGLRPTIDGRLGEWKEKSKISQGVSYKTPDAGAFDPTVHAVHVQDSLYVALNIPAYATPTLNFDLDGDGRWFGTGNTEIRFDVQDQGLARIRTFDASPEARQFEQQVLSSDRDVRSPDGAWDTNPKYQNEFERVYQSSDIRFDVRRADGQIGIEMAIPEREEREINFGTGSKIGLRIGYSNVQKNGGNATTFDKWSYVYYTLGESQAAVPKAAEETKLLKNIPNPFQSSTTVRYQTKETGQVEIAVYDMLGRRVRTLVDRKVQAGKDLQVRWSGNSVGSGMYFVRLRTESGQKDVRKVVHVQ
jgi:hypothetical protein